MQARRTTVSSRQAARFAVALLSLSLAATACGARFSRPSGAAQAGGSLDTSGGIGAGGGSGGGGSGGGGGGGGNGGVGPITGIGPSGGPLTGSSGGSGGGSGGGPGSGPSGGPNVGPSSGGGGSGGGGGGPVDPGATTGVTATDIRIAYLIPKSGAGQVPPQVDQGIQNYWKYIATKGGLFGRNVTVDIIDTKSSESGARAAAQTAIDNGDFIVTALDRLGVQGAIAKFLDAKGIPNVEVQVPVDLPSSMQWTFGITLDHRYQGTLIADYFAKVLHKTKVGYVRENDDTLIPGTDAFKAEAAKLGLQVVVSDVIDASQSQFLSEASNIAAKKPEACWLYMAPTPEASITTSTENDGYHPTWFANSISWNFNLGLSAAPIATVGARGFSPWPALNDPRTKFYRDNYAASGPPSVQDLGIPGWGLGQILASAIKSAGQGLGRNSFRNAMQHLDVSGTGPDGTPLLWAPLRFVDGQRQGGNSIVTFAQTGSGKPDTAWQTESDYRSSY